LVPFLKVGLVAYNHPNWQEKYQSETPLIVLAFWGVVYYLHPGKLTWNLKIFFGKGETSTNHQFLGSMLIFRGVPPFTGTRNNH